MIEHYEIYLYNRGIHMYKLFEIHFPEEETL